MSSQAWPMPYPQVQWTPGRSYNPARQLGALTMGDAAPATCPTRSYLWLAAAFAVGLAGGYKYSRKARKAGRRG